MTSGSVPKVLDMRVMEVGLGTVWASALIALVLFGVSEGAPLAIFSLLEYAILAAVALSVILFLPSLALWTIAIWAFRREGRSERSIAMLSSGFVAGCGAIFMAFAALDFCPLTPGLVAFFAVVPAGTAVALARALYAEDHRGEAE